MTDDTGTAAGQEPTTPQEPGITSPPTPPQEPATPPQVPPTPPTQSQTAEPTTPETPPPSETPEEEEPFDRDRAMRTIENLRRFEKLSKEQEKQLKGYQDRERDAEQAKLSQEERLTAQLKQRDAELAFEREQTRETINRYEVANHATKLGIVDPDAAVKLLDWGQLEYDEDGKPQDVEKALKLLIRDRPYLAAAASPAPTSPTNSATRTQAAGQRFYTLGELQNYEFYNAHRDDIQAAYKDGRILP